MHTQHPDNILSLQVIDGKISLEARLKRVKINRGQILALHEGVPYKIKAIKKTMILLTVIE